MFYRDELLFLREVFRRSHVNAVTLEPHELADRLTDGNADLFLSYSDVLRKKLPPFQPRTVYTLTDRLERTFRLLLLDGTEKPTVLCVGPYLSSPLSAQTLLELGERLGISPQKQRYLAEYYSGIPSASDISHLFTMLNVFCETMWKSPSFAVTDISNLLDSSDALVSRSMLDAPQGDTLVDIKTMERRYFFENEIMRAVSLGQPQMEDQLCAAFSSELFEKRAADPLRNAKNYCIIMNTLLRKAAEKGGVHPLHLNQMSSEFALKIEALPSLSGNTALMCEMFRSYCRLVRKHSLKHLSPVVRNTALMIDADISANLSPGTLAASQNISLGYLSTVFKKEMGQTVSSYIRTQRMKYAEHLLRTTNLQVQSVALHCGMMDVQYFSKQFKKHTGKTPTEFRADISLEP